MAIERTLSLIKPDCIGKHQIGKIISCFEQGGLYPIAMKMLHLTKERAEEFYDVHRERPFFTDLVSFVSSGPILAQVLEGEDAIAKNRAIMGATNPKDAAAGTIRAEFASSIDENAVHGSDAPETAKFEIAFFFTEKEILPRTRQAQGV